MTARDTTRTRSHNSGSRAPNDDAESILDYLETVDSATLDGLAAAAGLPEAQLHDLLDDLQQRGLVDVETGFRDVRVSRTEREVATDGGTMRTVGDAISGDASPSVDLTPNEVWTLVGTRRRRRLIRLLAVLHDSDDEYYLELKNVAAALVRTTTGARIPETRHEDHHRVYVSLVQTHVPLLDQHGVVEYHGRVKKVQATDEVLSLARVMELVVRACGRDYGEGSA